MEEKNLVIDDILVNYFQRGNLGENTPVFLHGWGSEAIHFKNILEICVNFIAVDLPGFGKSDKPKSVWGVNDYAIFLKNFLEKLNIQNPILIGHSFGGSIAMKFILFNPVKKLILISSAGIRKKNFKVFIYNILTKIAKPIFYLSRINLFRNKIIENYYKKIGAQDYIQAGEMREIFKKIIREDLSNDIKKIKTETVLIWGEDDKETPLKDGWLINSLIKNSKIYIIKDAGHFSFLDQPEEFKKILKQELKA